MPQQITAALPELPNEILTRLASYLWVAEACRLSRTCRGLQAALSTPSARAAALIGRHGTAGAGHILFWLIADAPMVLPRFDGGRWRSDRLNRDIAFLVLSCPNVRAAMPHNTLVDVAFAGSKADAICTATRSRAPEWLALLNDTLSAPAPDIIPTHYLLMLYETGDPSLFERIGDALERGASLSLDFLAHRPFRGRTVQWPIALWGEDDEDDQAPPLLPLPDVLKLIAPPSIRCFDLDRCSSSQLANLCFHYRDEICHVTSTRWRVRCVIRESGLGPEFVAELAAWENPTHDAAETSMTGFVAAAYENTPFDADSFMDLLEAAHDALPPIDLRLMLSSHPSQPPRAPHPALVQAQFARLSTDGTAALAPHLEALAALLRPNIDFAKSFDDWEEPRQPAAMMEWRRYFLYGEILLKLFETLGRVADVPGGFGRRRRWQGLD